MKVKGVWNEITFFQMTIGLPTGSRALAIYSKERVLDDITRATALNIIFKCIYISKAIFNRLSQIFFQLGKYGNPWRVVE